MEFGEGILFEKDSELGTAVFVVKVALELIFAFAYEFEFEFVLVSLGALEPIFFPVLTI